jgi:hypothetical protein
MVEFKLKLSMIHCISKNYISKSKEAIREKNKK